MIKSPWPNFMIKGRKLQFSGIFHPELFRYLHRKNHHMKIYLFGKFVPEIPKTKNFTAKNVIFENFRITIWYSLKKQSHKDF